MNDINTYKQSGELYLWEYTENISNYPGFHMSWASDGKSSFTDFLVLLRQAQPGTYRTLTLSKPNELILGVPNNKHQKIITKPKLRIELSGDEKSGIEVRNDYIYLKILCSEIDEMLNKLPDVMPQNELSIRVNKTDSISFWW